jgi:hypothetical protein
MYLERGIDLTHRVVLAALLYKQYALESVELAQI